MRILKQLHGESYALRNLMMMGSTLTSGTYCSLHPIPVWSAISFDCRRQWIMLSTATAHEVNLDFICSGPGITSYVPPQLQKKGGGHYTGFLLVRERKGEERKSFVRRRHIPPLCSRVRPPGEFPARGQPASAP